MRIYFIFRKKERNQGLPKQEIRKIPLFCSSAVMTNFLSSSSLTHSSVTIIPLVDYFYSIFNFSNYVHLCLFFISSRSLSNILIDFCIFFILFLRFWIIFTIITLNSFSDSLPNSSLFGFVNFYLFPLFAQYFSLLPYLFIFLLTYYV